MSGANLLDLLGSMEPCQVTIAEQNQARISHDNDENNPLLPKNNPNCVLRAQMTVINNKDNPLAMTPIGAKANGGRIYDS